MFILIGTLTTGCLSILDRDVYTLDDGRVQVRWTIANVHFDEGGLLRLYDPDSPSEDKFGVLPIWAKTMHASHADLSDLPAGTALLKQVLESNSKDGGNTDSKELNKALKSLLDEAEDNEIARQNLEKIIRKITFLFSK